MSALVHLGLRASLFSYGLLCFGLMGTRAIFEGYITRRPGSKFWEQVAKDRDHLWDLSKSPDGFVHGFFKAPNGLSMHYITKQTGSLNRTKNLVVFIHGWPDSCWLWREVVQALSPDALADTTIVAVDLPGFGGTESLKQYGPNDVLEPLAHFILGMRDQYLDQERYVKEDGNVLVVAHDWGALTGYRLAADAPNLADRFILTNAGHPTLVRDNITRRVTFAKQMFYTWLKQPYRLRLLRTAASNLGPVMTQLSNSFYIAIFWLPRPLPKLFLDVGGKWFLRVVSAVARRFKTTDVNSHTSMDLASSLGPRRPTADHTNEEGFEMVNKNQIYPDSVQQRSRLGGPGEGIRYYTDGVAIKPWDKTLELLAALHSLDIEGKPKRRSSSGAGLLEDGPPGSLKASTTIVWGKQDPAQDQRITIEGIKEYLCRGSQLVLLPKIAHWTPVDGQGTAAMAESIMWALEGADAQKLQSRMAAVCDGAKVTVEA